MAQTYSDLAAAYLKLAGRNPHRKVGTNLFDLTPRVRWNELQLNGIATLPDPPMPNWEYLHGKVLQVTGEGLLLRKYAQRDILHEDDYDLVLIRNHPFRVVDDDLLTLYALPSGRYQYTSLSGAVKTIRAYDHGVIPSEKEIEELKAHAHVRTELARSLADDAAAKQKEQALLKKEQAFWASVSYYRARAETNAFAQSRLGELLYSQSTNQAEGLQWLRRASTNGSQEAMEELRQIYSKEITTPSK